MTILHLKKIQDPREDKLILNDKARSQQLQGMKLFLIGRSILQMSSICSKLTEMSCKMEIFKKNYFTVKAVSTDLNFLYKGLAVASTRVLQTQLKKKEERCLPIAI